MALASLLLPGSRLLASPAPLKTKASNGQPPEDHSAHWAFQPIAQPVPPTVRNQAWPNNAIDRFVLAKLEAKGLHPSPPLAPSKLLRRLYLDLIGLPPTYEEVQAFLRDPSPAAFAGVVDQLLGRREYGERWARHWLDVARYADAKGYVDGGEVKYPFAYVYRDYVIDAFNQDLPYDRFVLEQIAADRLDNPPQAGSLAALGFLTVGSRYNFFPHEIIDDRIDVVMRGFLGLTAACARCHDHKFDPIPTKDYYALYGIFANSSEPTLNRSPRIGPPGAAEDAAFEKKLKEESEKYENLRRKLHEKIMLEMRSWAGDYLRYVVQSTPHQRTEDQPMLRTKRGRIRDFSAYAKGGVIRWRTFLESRNDNDPVFGLWARLGRLTREEIAPKYSSILASWEASGTPNPLVLAALAGKTVASMADLADLYGALLEDTDQRWRKQLQTTPQAKALEDAALEQVRQALYGPEAPGTMTLDESGNCYTLEESMDVRARYADIERVFLKPWEGMAPRAMVLEDRPDLVEAHVFVRGNPQNLGERVDKRMPSLLAALSGPSAPSGSGRLELARSIVHPDNPLAARVMVNRIWEWHFGNGLVETPSDFGLRSAPPTHPELLDYLAHWFRENGWSMKQLHRLILLSSTWQQAALDQPQGRESDPDNHWLWRANRRHLDFECMRDSMLSVAGQLQPSPGGLPVQKRPDDASHHRRTIYSFVDRERLADIYRVFDFPTPDITAPKRSRTMVPQQTLFLMNSPFVISQAQALTTRLGWSSEGIPPKQPSEISQTIVRLFRLVHGRDPESDELALAQRFVTGPDAPASGAADAREANQLWIELAQTLLVSNEFLYAD